METALDGIDERFEIFELICFGADQNDRRISIG